MRVRDQVSVTLLLVDAVLLAVLELMFLPLRFDGRLLPQLGDAIAPVSILLAVVTTPWLVAQTARASSSGGMGGLALALWFITLVIVGAFGPGGDMVFVADWRSLVLLASGLIPGAVMVGVELGRQKVDRARLQGSPHNGGVVR